MLDSGNLDAYGLQLASIGSALTAIGDILLYGCNVAQGGVGMQFISLLAQITGADVTASDDLTGNENLNGDWEFWNRLQAASTQSPYSGVISQDCY